VGGVKKYQNIKKQNTGHIDCTQLLNVKKEKLNVKIKGKEKKNIFVFVSCTDKHEMAYRSMVIFQYCQSISFAVIIYPYSVDT